jgi:hypothetical protein
MTHPLALPARIRLASFVAAALFTLAMLAGVDGIASADAAGAQMAQATSAPQG